MLGIIKDKNLTPPEIGAAERQHYNPVSNPKPESDESLE
jgi:hypothetical protein